LDQLLTIARAMEREAIEGYEALSRRMSALGRRDLGAVFDSLVLEETGHLGKVDEWRAASGGGDVDVAADPPHDLFQDEGAGTVAPELMSAYRAFSTAVRNEERAFAFWTYVSAHAQSDEIKDAAERMAREELGHVSTLRKERRKAFHTERAIGPDVKVSLNALEKTLRRQIKAVAAAMPPNRATILRDHLREAHARGESIALHPFNIRPPYKIDPAQIVEALPLSEYLLDWYLDIGDRAKNEQDAGRARLFAAQLLACLRTLRSLRETG
jgi:rubrerythrin